MNRLVSRITLATVVGFLTLALSTVICAAGKSKSCHQCGCEKQVKQVCRLVKVCEDIDLPSYVYTKEEVFYPHKGPVCYTGFRSDTFYHFWRTSDCVKDDVPFQHAPHCDLSQLHSSAYTVCVCKTLYGAKSSGEQSGCTIRVPGKTRQMTTPILKWVTVPLCKDCCEKAK